MPFGTSSSKVYVQFTNHHCAGFPTRTRRDRASGRAPEIGRPGEGEVRGPGRIGRSPSAVRRAFPSRAGGATWRVTGSPSRDTGPRTAHRVGGPLAAICGDDCIGPLSDRRPRKRAALPATADVVWGMKLLPPARTCRHVPTPDEARMGPGFHGLLDPMPCIAWIRGPPRLAPCSTPWQENPTVLLDEGLCQILGPRRRTRPRPGIPLVIPTGAPRGDGAARSTLSVLVP